MMQGYPLAHVTLSHAFMYFRHLQADSTDLDQILVRGKSR